MRRAYQRAAADADADKGSFTSIVLMTDGENNRGIPVDEFLTGLEAMADPAELQRIVQATAGARFDANKTSLAAAFKEIRGYQ
jgi:Ca-activated chloride channel homolog